MRGLPAKVTATRQPGIGVSDDWLSGGKYSSISCKGEGTAISQIKGLVLVLGSGIIRALFLLAP